MIWTMSVDFTNRYLFMIGKIYFSFWKKKHCNYFFINFIRENDISVRTRTWQNFSPVSRSIPLREHRSAVSERCSSRMVTFHAWLRYINLPLRNKPSLFYPLLHILLPIFRSIKVSQELSSNTRNFENIRGQYKYTSSSNITLKKNTLTFDWITNNCESSFVSVEVVRAKKRRSESRNIMASVPREARKRGSSRGGKMKECGKNSPVVVCIDGSTSSGDVEATTTPPIRQSPATARRKHLSWIRILPHSCDHGPSETLFEHQQSCTRD